MDDLTIEVAGGIARLTLNRPEKHNALSARMISELTEAAALLGADPEVRAVMLTGAGKSFCAGADLGWMRAQIEAGPQERAAEARRIAMMLRALNEMPKPLIGMVQGNAFGGGIGMMSVCDTVVADEAALFGLTETRLGIIPATIGPYVIARMGEGFARRVFMSGNRFGAAKAVELGLISSLHSAAELEAAALAEAAPYLACAPGAVAAAKALTRRLGPVIDDATIDMSIAALIAQWESSEAAEGIAAFFERRPASWVIAP
ncbi:crotonase/enoyl-CoA hydratase family protein [Alphaproteobacteria bacterium KMM 3653]|uniref:Crotonase/enoyl-CoA hydratase family protein n=1 Tax=Harenicola maris TaxID=2841044 RepID=A0AAP2CKV9_9RHOB|nr:crotonase/enoyl-CoA hydratase family protein [Harenicola maris]